MYTGENEIVIENQGIGYRIYIPLSVLEELPSVGEPVTIHTYLNVREDAMQLFGFLSREDLEMFELLITVNGIGPKAALGILSSMSAGDIRFAIISEDAKTIAKAPGIGAKTANKLILELKDKIDLEEMIAGEGSNMGSIGIPSAAASVNSQNIQDAIEALVVLGYPKTEAAKAVRAVENAAERDVEELLKESLKHI